MKRVLIVTTVSGFVPQFEMNNVRILQEMGYEVHYASNFKNPHYGKDNHRLEGTGIVCHQVDFVRSPFRLIRNMRAYVQIRKLMRENQFQMVHCHTPMGGVLARLGARKYRRTGTKVLYTAHGFHFYKGAPVFNWLFYYPVEWLLARWTDVLITINEEDYQRAKRFPLPENGRVEKVNGVGIDIEAYRDIKVNREEKRRELGIPSEKRLMVSVGELNRNKNHRLIIGMLRKVKNADLMYLIIGEVKLEKKLFTEVKRDGLEKQVKILGYRADVKEILDVSDIFVLPSKREGLPVAMMEAMAMKLPVLCTDIRGNCDLIDEGKGGYLINQNNSYLWKNRLQALIDSPAQNLERMGYYNYWKIQELFSNENVEREMRRIYAYWN